MYARILVPVDGSSLSEQALPYVQQLGLGLSIPVTLMTVVEPSPPSIGLHLGSSSQEQDTVRHRADHAVAYLNSLADALRSDGVTVSTVTPSGSPAQEIIQEAAREADTLVAMTTHGRSGAGCLAASPTASYVTLKTRCWWCEPESESRCRGSRCRPRHDGDLAVSRRGLATR